MLSHINEKSDAPSITLLAKPRIGRSGRTPALPYPPVRLKAILWYRCVFILSMYNHSDEGVQPLRRRCTVSSVDTVQFTATKVFNSQRPRCSTSPPYSLSVFVDMELVSWRLPPVSRRIYWE